MVRDLVEDKPSSLFSNQWLFSLEIYFGFEFWVFQCLLSMGAERERGGKEKVRKFGILCFCVVLVSGKWKM